MIYTPFLEHLRDSGLSMPVVSALSTEPVTDYADDFPVCMVYPLSDALGENGADNFVIQERVAELACLIGCELSALSGLVQELREASIGWVPGGTWDAMEGAGGNIEGLTGPYVWWRETFTARTQFRQTT